MPSDCTARALKLLSGRSHFRRQLEAKLVTRGYEADEIEATLDRLTELGYLDDERTAGELIRERRRRGPVGRRRLSVELERRGADPAAAQAALDEACADDDDRTAARAAAERWLSRRSRGGAGESVERRVAALARHLERQGFEPSSIAELVRETRAEAGAGGDLRGERDEGL